MAVGVSVCCCQYQVPFGVGGLSEDFRCADVCCVCVFRSLCILFNYLINIPLRRSWGRVVEEYLYAQTAWSSKNR
jgi:hypothetical protein